VFDYPWGVFAAGVAGIAAASVAAVHAAGTAVTAAPPVVVTATRVDESAARYVIGARIVTARDIERSGAPNLSEFLRSLPKLRARELPGSPNAQIDMRGFGSFFGDQNTLVLLDGMRVREYEQLTVNWSAIPLSSIERIEILPAGSSVLYGSGATGGVINIVTRPLRGESRSAYVGGGIGSYDTAEFRAGGGMSGGAGTGAVGWRAHGSHYGSDNYRDNSRVRIDSAQAALDWAGEAGSLGLKFGADDQRNGLPGVISEAQMAVNRRQAATPNDFATQDGAYVNATADARIGSGDLAVNFGYRNRDISSHFLVGTPLRNNVDTRVDVWTLAPRLRLRPQWGGWDSDFIVGGDFDDWRLDATSAPTIASRPHSTQRSAALYAQYTARFDTGTTLGLGAREQHARYDAIDLANPGANGARSHTLHAWDIAARHALTPDASVLARLGSNFRLPNVNDNFNPFFARVTLLEPQTARESSLGLEGKTGEVRLRGAVYHIDLSNEIFFDPVTLGSRNRQPTRRKGFELDGGWQAGPSLELRANYIYADATFRDGRAGGVSIAGNRVPLAPRHILSAGLGWQLAEKARMDFDVRYAGSSVFDADETNTFGRLIPAYTVADLKLTVRTGGWLINAGVRNLFGEEYYPYGVFTGRPTFLATPAAERSMFVSAQYAFR
jgi:iron complex outermembrane receptor protein